MFVPRYLPQFQSEFWRPKKVRADLIWFRTSFEIDCEGNEGRICCRYPIASDISRNILENETYIKALRWMCRSDYINANGEYNCGGQCMRTPSLSMPEWTITKHQFEGRVIGGLNDKLHEHWDREYIKHKLIHTSNKVSRLTLLIIVS